MKRRDESWSMWGTGWVLARWTSLKSDDLGESELLTPLPKPPRTPSTLASIPSQYLTPLEKSGPAGPLRRAEPTFERARLDECCSYQYAHI